MPASFSALAITLAPRSWPSNPGLAITIRMGLLRLEAIIATGAFGGDQPQPEVAPDSFGVALARVAVAPGARQLEGHYVAVVQVDRSLATDLALSVGSGVDHRPAQLAGAPAEEPEGREPVALRQVGELDRFAQDAHVAAHAQSAALLTGAGRVGDEAEALHDHRGVGLDRLDGDVGGVVGRAHGFAAVLGGAAADAAVDQLVAHEPPPPDRIPGSEGGVAEMAVGGGHRLRQRRRERAQDDLEDAAADRRARTAARRPWGIEKAALGRHDLDRAQGARVHGAVGVGEALDGGVHIGPRVVEVAVQSRLGLR